MIAKVIVNVSSSNTDTIYQYKVLPQDENIIKIGSRVKVPFSDSNRIVMGYVLDICDNTDYNGELKEIKQLIDFEPSLSDVQIKTAYFIKEDAVCPMCRILNQMIPKALIQKTTKYLTLVNLNGIDARLAALFEKSDVIEYNSTLKPFNTIIANEIKKGNIIQSYDTKNDPSFKKVTKYCVNLSQYYNYGSTINSLSSREFLDRFKDDTYKTIQEIVDTYEVSVWKINYLYKKGFLEKHEEKVSRIKNKEINVTRRTRNIDNVAINSLLNKVDNYEKPILFLSSSFEQTNQALLQCINKMIKENKNVVIFVPEILSSYNVFNYIRKNTGLDIALINSNLSEGEEYDYYEEIKNDSYRVIITTSKGALFPYQNVGLYILLDSESDNYYSDQSPRYDLHKVFEYMASLTSSKVIRTSLSPTITEYTYGLKNYLDIVSDLDTNSQINVKIVDLKEELLIGNNTSLSTQLQKSILLQKAKGKKTILIVNNRSYSSYVLCRKCGNVEKCPRCMTSLSYNKKSNMLICPACSTRKPFEKTCSKCGCSELRLGGKGIEQVEEDIKEFMPNIRVSTLSVNHFDTYSMITEEFESGNIDLLITTSVYSNSIDFSNVGLVGVINIDSTSRAADYDATQRAYSTLVHLKKKLNNSSENMLLIQTYNKDDTYLNNFLTSDYHGFIKAEVVTRKVLKNEPFYFVNKILVKTNYEEMFKIANNIKEYLKACYGYNVFILGPTYNAQNQAAQIIIKHKIKDISLAYQEIYKKYMFTKSVIIIDKYPRYI